MSLHGLEKAILGLAIVLLLGIFVSMAGKQLVVAGFEDVGGRKNRSEVLSPNAVFVFVATIVMCFVISLFSDRRPPPSLKKDGKHRPFSDIKPIVKPAVDLGEISTEELGAYDGSDYTKPLLLAVNLQIFDVTTAWGLYGPGGKRHMFAGKDVSIALVNGSSKYEDFNVDPSCLDFHRRSSLKEQELSFKRKFAKVGTIKKPGGAPDAC